MARTGLTVQHSSRQLCCFSVWNPVLSIVPVTDKRPSRAHAVVLLSRRRLQCDSHLFKYVECFQLKCAFEPPKWDLCCWASSVCVCAPRRIKAHSTVLISDTDYDSGFYERHHYCQIQYQW